MRLCLCGGDRIQTNLYSQGSQPFSFNNIIDLSDLLRGVSLLLNKVVCLLIRCQCLGICLPAKITIGRLDQPVIGRPVGQRTHQQTNLRNLFHSQLITGFIDQRLLVITYRLLIKLFLLIQLSLKNSLIVVFQHLRLLRLPAQDPVDLRNSLPRIPLIGLKLLRLFIHLAGILIEKLREGIIGAGDQRTVILFRLLLPENGSDLVRAPAGMRMVRVNLQRPVISIARLLITPGIKQPICLGDQLIQPRLFSLFALPCHHQ